MADVLNHITMHLSQKAVQSVLDGVTLGTAHRAKGCDPTVVESNHNIEKEVCIAAGWVSVEMHMTDWAKAQREDPVLNAVFNWLEAQKKTDLETLLGEHASSEEGLSVWWNHQNFMTLQNAFYLHSIPKGKNEDLPLFVVLKTH